MLKCSYFSKFYENVHLIMKSIGYENVKLDMYTMVCGHKPDLIEYCSLNLILNIIFFTEYKCWVRIKIYRKHVDPTQILYEELQMRCETNCYNYAKCRIFRDALETFLNRNVSDNLCK